MDTCSGIVHEGSAEIAARGRGNMIATIAPVSRKGVAGMIPAMEVVPGDIIILSLRECM